MAFLLWNLFYKWVLVLKVRVGDENAFDYNVFESIKLHQFVPLCFTFSNKLIKINKLWTV